MTTLRRSSTATATEIRQAELMVYVLNFFAYILSILFTIGFLVGAYDYIRNVEKNKCEMTYMYEFPQYVKIPMPLDGEKQFAMYGLYAYTEGKQIQAVRNMQFSGIPVLFLPGNAGSHKQVRSFASVALRKWLNGRTPFHFDFFTIDFNEEMSGLYGYVLERQSQYARLAVEKIMSFYEDFHHVVLIGHSMGGIVAKSINTDEIKSQLIFTLATPHQRALVLTDPELDLFYYYVNRNWTGLMEAEAKEISLVSVAGGDRDLIIPNKLTVWKHNDIQTSAPSVRGVWVSTDHLCIVWCKQLVMTVVRSLFDLVEYRKKGSYYAITSNTNLRTRVLEYHFLERTGGKSYHSAHPVETPGVPPSVLWNEYLKHDYCQPPSQQLTYLMFPVVTFDERVKGNPDKYKVLVSTSNTKAKNWIFGCVGQKIVKDVMICSDMVNLSNQTDFLPSFHRRTKIIHLNYSGMKQLKFSHLVVKLDPVNYPSCVNIDVYNKDNRTNVLGTKVQTNGEMFFKFNYPNTSDITKATAWRLTAKLLHNERNNNSICKANNAVGIFQNGYFQTHNFFRNESLLIRFSDWSANPSYALVYLVKGCEYSLSLKLAWVETAGQLFRTYWRFLPSHITSIVLMTIFFQKPKDWINFHRVLITKAYYLTLLPGFISAFLLALLPNDFRSSSMMNASEFTIFIPIMCYLISYILVLAIATGAYYVMLGTGGALHTLATRFLTKKLGNVPDQVTDLALTVTLEKLPITVAVLILSIAMTTCGTMGLAIGLFIYLFKIFKSYENILEDLVRGKITNIGDALSPINFHVHCSMLWFIITLYNLPSLIFWINNFSYSEVTQWDLSLYLCLMLTPALAILWQGFVPDFNPTMWIMQRYVCYMMGLVTVLWGTHRYYLVSLMVVLVLITIAMCQLLSRFAETDSSEPEPQQGAASPNNNPSSSTLTSNPIKTEKPCSRKNSSSSETDEFANYNSDDTQPESSDEEKSSEANSAEKRNGKSAEEKKNELEC